MSRIRPGSSPAGAVVPSGIEHLSTPKGVESVDVLTSRLSQLNAHFNLTDDRRGVFTAVYAPCVRRLVRECRAGNFEDPAIAERVVLALGRTYLEGLHRDGHGKDGAAGSAWDSFARFTLDPSSSDARLLASAVNAHWSMDLPNAVAAVGPRGDFHADFQKVGGFIVEEILKGIDKPEGPNGRRVAEVFKSQPALVALARVFGLENTLRTSIGVLLAEAFASGRIPKALAPANQVKWASREALINLL